MSSPTRPRQTDAASSETAVITLCSTPRLAHLRAQLAALGHGPAVRRVVVWLGADAPPPLDAEEVLAVPPSTAGLRLAAARNAGAAAALAAGADLLIFLDADCIPGADLVGRYRAAAGERPGAVLCGPVTYLPPGAPTDPAALRDATAPHPARPAPEPGRLVTASADEYRLFWSLSFAVPAGVWRAGAGFDEAYEGYGGEDTDYAFALRRDAVPLVWVGGADAYHQHHPTESPPWSHLDDILRNGAIFARRWGQWPMSGWLEAFAAAGAIRRDGDGWARVSR